MAHYDDDTCEGCEGRKKGEKREERGERRTENREHTLHTHYTRTSDGCSVAADPLGRTLDDDVGAVLDGSAVVPAGTECIIDDQRDAVALRDVTRRGKKEEGRRKKDGGRRKMSVACEALEEKGF